MKNISFAILAICLFTFQVYSQGDNCTGAVTLPQNGTCVNGTTVGATPSFASDMSSLAGCGPTGASGDDVWGSFVATNTYWTFNLTTATSGPIGVVLFDNGCASGTFNTISQNCVNGTSLTGSYNGLSLAILIMC